MTTTMTSTATVRGPIAFTPPGDRSAGTLTRTDAPSAPVWTWRDRYTFTTALRASEVWAAGQRAADGPVSDDRAALSRAVASGDATAVAAAVAACADPVAAVDGRTVLHETLIAGHGALVPLLLQDPRLRAIADRPDAHGITPLAQAVHWDGDHDGDWRAVQALVRAGADPNQLWPLVSAMGVEDDDWNDATNAPHALSVVEAACALGRIPQATILVRLGATPGPTNPSLESGHKRAEQSGYVPWAERALADHQNYINENDAVRHWHGDLLAWAMTEGGAPTISSWKNVLSSPWVREMPGALKNLAQVLPRIVHTPAVGPLPIRLLALLPTIAHDHDDQAGCAAILDAYTEEEFDVLAPFLDGATLLHRAAAAGNSPLTAALLARGANPQTPDADGRSALDHAAHADVRAVLERAVPPRGAGAPTSTR